MNNMIKTKGPKGTKENITRISIRIETVRSYINYLTNQEYVKMCEEKHKLLDVKLEETCKRIQEEESMLLKFEHNFRDNIKEMLSELELEYIVPYIFVNNKLSSFLERCCSAKVYQKEISDFFKYFDESLTQSLFSPIISTYIQQLKDKKEGLEKEFRKNPTYITYVEYPNESINYPKLDKELKSTGLEWKFIEQEFFKGYTDNKYRGDKSKRINATRIYSSMIETSLELVNRMTPSKEIECINDKLQEIYDSHITYSKDNICRNPLDMYMLNSMKKFKVELEKLFKLL